MWTVEYMPLCHWQAQTFLKNTIMLPAGLFSILLPQNTIKYHKYVRRHSQTKTETFSVCSDIDKSIVSAQRLHVKDAVLKNSIFSGTISTS